MSLPPISLSDTDRSRLASVATSALQDRAMAPTASILLSEIARATVVADGSLPRRVVAMHSQVDIYDNIERSDRKVRIVYPHEAGLDAESISVLTPLSTALIGLSEGDSIGWCTATGDPSSVIVLRTSRNRGATRRLMGAMEES